VVLKITYPDFIVSQLKAREFFQVGEVFDLLDLVGAEVELFQVDQGIKVLDFPNAVERQVEDSMELKILKTLLKQKTNYSYSRFTSESKFSITVI